MTIDRETFKELIKILEPFMRDNDSRKALVDGAFYNTSLLTTIELSGTPRNFTTRLVQNVMNYGELESGIPAIRALLEEATTLVGGDRAEQITQIMTKVLSQLSYESSEPITESSDDANLVDQKIDEYLLIERVGSGGFGEVYRAEHIPSGDIVAFKLTLDSALLTPDFDKRFEREIEILKALRHTHIVSFRAYGQYKNKPYVILEWLPRGDLRKQLENKILGFPIEEVSAICLQISTALDYIHKKNIIHRDLKPENILVRDDNSYLITDFGIAKPLSYYTRISESGLGIGTLKYAAPEQLTSPHVTKQVDIYSLGLMIYELITGQYPFADPLQRLTTPLPTLDNIIKHGGTEMDAILATATAVEPQNRYTNVGEFLREFQNVLK